MQVCNGGCAIPAQLHPQVHSGCNATRRAKLLQSKAIEWCATLGRCLWTCIATNVAKLADDCDLSGCMHGGMEKRACTHVCPQPSPCSSGALQADSAYVAMIQSTTAYKAWNAEVISRKALLHAKCCTLACSFCVVIPVEPAIELLLAVFLQTACEVAGCAWAEGDEARGCAS